MVISRLLSTSSLLNEIKLPSDVKFMKLSNICLSSTLLYTLPIKNRKENDILLAWSMESGVLNSISSLDLTSKHDIHKHVWYSISSLVFNPNVGFESQVRYLQ